LPNAGTNLGFGGLPPHDERYRRAEEYLDVTYKLWEGSWEEGAVLRDTARDVYADPAPIPRRSRQDPPDRPAKPSRANRSRSLMSGAGIP